MNLVYFFALSIMVLGLFVMLTSDNYLRKIIGLGVFQSSVLLFYIALGKVNGGIPPIIREKGINIYSSPLPSVLMLTAIVVGFATLSVSLALIFKIYQRFGTINESEITREENSDLDQ